MSGGSFCYKDYELGTIAEKIEREITIRTSGEYGYQLQTLSKMETVVFTVNLVKEWLHSIDYLMAGDSEEEYFQTEFNKILEDALNSRMKRIDDNQRFIKILRRIGESINNV